MSRPCYRPCHTGLVIQALLQALSSRRSLLIVFFSFLWFISSYIFRLSASVSASVSVRFSVRVRLGLLVVIFIRGSYFRAQ